MILIKGGAYGSFKSRGDKKARDAWREEIKEATATIPKFKGPCAVELLFCLPPNRFPKDFPHGPDLDNLAHLILDAMGETVFSDALGKDSCVVSLSLNKRKADRPGEEGVLIMVEYGKERFPDCLRRVKDFEVLDWR